MTTEDDFQRRLNRSPRDRHTRLVLADFLQERGDCRAEGYRALGLLGRVPLPYTDGDVAGSRGGATEWTLWGVGEGGVEGPEVLPGDWFALIAIDLADPADRGDNYRSRPTRRTIEDAALAFSNLPTGRRAELLPQEGAAPPRPAPRKPPRKVRKPAAKKPKGKRQK